MAPIVTTATGILPHRTDDPHLRDLWTRLNGIADIATSDGHEEDENRRLLEDLVAAVEPYRHDWLFDETVREWCVCGCCCFLDGRHHPRRSGLTALLLVFGFFCFFRGTLTHHGKFILDACFVCVLFHYYRWTSTTGSIPSMLWTRR